MDIFTFDLGFTIKNQFFFGTNYGFAFTIVYIFLVAVTFICFFKDIFTNVNSSLNSINTGISIVNVSDMSANHFIVGLIEANIKYYGFSYKRKYPNGTYYRSTLDICSEEEISVFYQKKNASLRYYCGAFESSEFYTALYAVRCYSFPQYSLTGQNCSSSDENYQIYFAIETKSFNTTAKEITKKNIYFEYQNSSLTEIQFDVDQIINDKGLFYNNTYVDTIRGFLSNVITNDTNGAWHLFILEMNSGYNYRYLLIHEKVPILLAKCFSIERVIFMCLYFINSFFSDFYYKKEILKNKLMHSSNQEWLKKFDFEREKKKNDSEMVSMFKLHTQEVMNNEDISVYNLDKIYRNYYFIAYLSQRFKKFFFCIKTHKNLESIEKEIQEYISLKNIIGKNYVNVNTILDSDQIDESSITKLDFLAKKRDFNKLLGDKSLSSGPFTTLIGQILSWIYLILFCIIFYFFGGSSYIFQTHSNIKFYSAPITLISDNNASSFYVDIPIMIVISHDFYDYIHIISITNTTEFYNPPFCNDTEYNSFFPNTTRNNSLYYFCTNANKINNISDYSLNLWIRFYNCDLLDTISFRNPTAPEGNSGSKCPNTYDLPSQYIDPMYFNFIIKGYYIDTSNKNHPIQENITQYEYTFTLNSTIWYLYNLTTIELIDDTNLLYSKPESYYFSQLKLLQMREITVNFLYEYWGFYFIFEYERIFYQRQYKKIGEVLGEIFALMTVIKLLLTLINEFFNEFYYMKYVHCILTQNDEIKQQNNVIINYKSFFIDRFCFCCNSKNNMEYKNVKNKLIKSLSFEDIINKNLNLNKFSISLKSHRFDMFRIQPYFYMNASSRLVTKTGGILSIILFIILFLCISFFVNEFRKRPISQIDIFSKKLAEFSYTDEIFSQTVPFSFGVPNNSSYTDGVRILIGGLIKYMDFYYLNNISICSDEQYSYFYNTTNNNSSMIYYCSNFDNITYNNNGVGGRADYFPRVYIYQLDCTNVPVFCDWGMMECDPTCVQNPIGEFSLQNSIKNLKVFSLNDYDNYIKDDPNQITVINNISVDQENYLFKSRILTRVIYNNDNNILFSSINSNKFISIGDEEWNPYPMLVSLEFRPNSVLIITRVFEKIPELLLTIFSISATIIAIFQSINNIFNDFSFNAFLFSLFKNVINFDKLKKKEDIALNKEINLLNEIKNYSDNIFTIKNHLISLFSCYYCTQNSKLYSEMVNELKKLYTIEEITKTNIKVK